MIEVIADSNRQNTLRLFLLHNKAIEVIANFLRFPIKVPYPGESLISGLALLGLIGCSGTSGIVSLFGIVS